MKECWEYKKLSLVCSKITDGSHFSPKVDENGIYPMLSVKDMMAIGFNYTTCKYINENDYNVLVANGCKPKVNDVLVAKDGSYLKTAFVLKEDKEQVLLSSIAIITPRLDEIVPEYLAFYFKAPHTKSVVEKHYLTGTAIKRVILKGFKTITIPVPPLSEQQHIVEELDLLSSIIEKKKAQLIELDNLAQSLFYEMFGDLIDNPKGWDIRKLGDILKIPSRNGLSKPTAIRGEGVPMISMGEMFANSIITDEVKASLVPVTERELETSQIVSGDLLFARQSLSLEGAGKCSYVKSCLHPTVFESHLIRIRVNSIVVLPQFVFCYFQTPCGIAEVRKRVYQVAAAGIKGSELIKIPIPVPPIDLQKEFASKIETIEHQKELIKQSIKEVETLFNSRMDYYFN